MTCSNTVLKSKRGVPFRGGKDFLGRKSWLKGWRKNVLGCRTPYQFIPGHKVELMAYQPGDFSEFKVVRLNSELFPVREFEQEAYDRYQISPICVEATGNRILKTAADCDALFVVSETLPAEVINGLRRCRVISRLGAGTDKIDQRAASKEGILITNVPDFCAEEQADHTMALLLAVARKLPEMQQMMHKGRWSDARAMCRPLRRLREQVLGLVGFGFSAKGVARRAAGFGLRVIATRRNNRKADPDVAALGVELTDLNTLLSESDFLSLHLPLNDQTRGLFDAEKLSRMKKGAILINTARGALLDETALAEALLNGHLAGAGLDTFHQIDVHSTNQSPPKHPLLELGNVVFTPHVAAFSVESSRDVGYGAVENAAAVLAGNWPPAAHLVNIGVVPRFELKHIE